MSDGGGAGQGLSDAFADAGRVLDQDGPVVAFLDPGDVARGGPMVPRAELLAKWSGRILLVQPALAVGTEVRPFGLAWFMLALRAGICG